MLALIYIPGIRGEIDALVIDEYVPGVHTDMNVVRLRVMALIESEERSLHSSVYAAYKGLSSAYHRFGPESRQFAVAHQRLTAAARRWEDSRGRYAPMQHLH